MRKTPLSPLAAICLFILTTAPAFCRADSPAPTNLLLDAVTANFSAWDTNHDGCLSTAELDAAIENPANKGPAAAALATLWAALSGDEPPVTLANIRKFALRKGARAYYSMCLERIRKVSRHELFVSGLPQLNSIHQGLLGDCFSLAPLGAMVYRDPHEVASWFEVQSNGNVLVKMAAGTVAVPLPTDAEIAFASANSANGVWIDLYEKAIAEARNERKPPGKRFEVAFDTIANGGDEVPILSYITAHKVTVFPLSSERNNVSPETHLARLRAKVAFASSNKLLMVADTINPSTPGLMPTHAYALLDYDPGSDAVKLWNPHGNNFKPGSTPGLSHGYPMTNGVFTMPLPDFAAQFDRVIFERPETTSLKWTDQWELMAQAGRFAEAATDLAEVIDSDESENLLFYLLTPLLIQSGQLTQYTNNCKFMLNQFEHTSNPSVAERTAKSCLLLPSVLSPQDFSRATNLAARAVSLSRAGAWLHWRLMTRGLAEYRAGRYDDAIASEHLSQIALVKTRDLNGPACESDTFFISAMSHEKLNQKKDAQTDLEHGLEIVQKKLPKLDCGDLGDQWFDTLMSHIIMREARQTIEGTSAIAEKPWRNDSVRLGSGRDRRARRFALALGDVG